METKMSKASTSKKNHDFVAPYKVPGPVKPYKASNVLEKSAEMVLLY